MNETKDLVGRKMSLSLLSCEEAVLFSLNVCLISEKIIKL